MLTEQLTNDAAALYQALLRHGGEVSPFSAEKSWAGRTAASPVPWRSWWTEVFWNRQPPSCQSL